MDSSLTSRQQQVLDFIGSYHRVHGYSPTMREIAAHIGVSSTNGVNDHLKALARKGYVENAKPRKPGRGGGLARTLRLTGAADPITQLTEGVKTLARALDVDLGAGPLPADWLNRCVEAAKVARY